MEQTESLQPTVLEEMGIHMQSVSLDTDFIPFTKVNPKWIIDLKVKCKIIKLIEDNRKNLRWFWAWWYLLDITPKAWSMKKIVDNLNFMKIKNFSFQKTKSRETEDKPQTGRKYLQKIHLIKVCYPKYTQNS